jgi:predicted phage terminase large subunit-like protein
MAEKRNMTRREFDERIKDLTKLITEQTIAFADDSALKKVERISRAKTDLIYFAKTYFPHYIYSEFADFHVEELSDIQEALDTNQTSIVAEAWFRGSGKSSLLAVILPIWAGITKRSYFTIFSGADRELTRERTICAKLEFVYNGRLRYDYPDFGMDINHGEETDFEVNGIRYLALGYKMAIKGKMHGRHRPRLIIIDDLESHLDTNPKIAEKKYMYVTEEAFGGFGPKGGLMLWLGNLTNSSSALHKFIERCKAEPNPYMRNRIVKALDDDGNSRWPQAYTKENLDAKKAVMGKAGFDRHYLMKPGIDGDIFKEDWLRFYNPFGQGSQNVKAIQDSGFNIQLPTLDELRQAPTISYCDPSLGANETNDYKSIVTVAMWSGMHWILDVFVRRCSILDMLDYMYELDTRFKTRHFMETNFWQRIILNFLPQKASEKGYILPICGVENRLKKEERILTLEPLFQWGHIVSCVVGKDWNLLKEQLIGFPNAGNDDAPDALAGAVARFREIATANKYERVESRQTDYRSMF